MSKNCYFYRKAVCRLHGYSNTVPTTVGGRSRALFNHSYGDDPCENCEVGREHCSYISEGIVPEGCARCAGCRYSTDYPGNEDMEFLMDLYDKEFAGTASSKTLISQKTCLFGRHNVAGHCNIPEIREKLDVRVYVPQLGQYLYVWAYPDLKHYQLRRLVNHPESLERCPTDGTN